MISKPFSKTNDLFSGDSERVSQGNPCHDPMHKGCNSSDGVEIHLHDSGALTGYCWPCSSWYSPEEVNKIDGVEDGVLDPDLICETASTQYTQNRLKAAQSFPFMKPWRGISNETFRYSGTRMRGSVHYGTTDAVLFEYYSREDDEFESELCGYKVRVLPKTMFVLGGTKGSKLYLQPQAEELENKGYLVITEGEPDALTCLDVLKEMTGKWCRVTSLPTGGSIRSIINNLEFVESHDKVVFWGDNDEVGLRCINAMREILGDRLIAITSDTVKDANDELLKGGGIAAVFEILKGALK